MTTPTVEIVPMGLPDARRVPVPPILHSVTNDDVEITDNEQQTRNEPENRHHKRSSFNRYSPLKKVLFSRQYPQVYRRQKNQNYECSKYQSSGAHIHLPNIHRNTTKITKPKNQKITPVPTRATKIQAIMSRTATIVID
jgi:hypothetical protein